MILSYIRTVILYLILIAVIRVMGKRQIGEMEASEFVVTMLVANLAAIPMQDGGIPLFSGLVPILTVLGVELVLSALALRSIFLRRLLCGSPVVLIENGRAIQQNLRRTRMTLDELQRQLRTNQITDIRSVQMAILETDGSFSVFPYAKDKPATAGEAGIKVKAQTFPTTVISDGKLLRNNLAQAGKDEAWVQRVLQQNHAEIRDTWLLTVDSQDTVRWCRKEMA